MTAARTRPCEAAAIRSARGAACTVAQQRWVLAATILASTIAYVDESVVNVALPAIGRDLAASPAALQWVINAYTLCLAAFLLVGGAAGDRLGRRRVFIAGVMLIGARAVQGAGAALLIPCSLALIGAAFSDGERGRAIGTWAGFSAIAAAIGPLLGGWIVDRLAPSAGKRRSRGVGRHRLAGCAAGLRWPGRRGLRVDRAARHGLARRHDGSDVVGWRRLAVRLRLARGALACTDDAARPVPFGRLQRRQCAHLPALWRAGRRLVP